jgi:hypothetical protein
MTATASISTSWSAYRGSRHRAPCSVLDRDVRDDVPDTDEVIARLSNDEHGRLEQTLRAHTAGGEGGEEVLDG